MPKATPLFRTEKKIPTAARMRPRTLDEFVGQEHITGPGKVSRQAIETDHLLYSLILWGPAGTGQNSLAMVIANATKSHFQSLSTVLAGVKDLQRIIEGAKARHTAFGQRTILLVDEIHRWNKAQQDALLPHVEDGTIILMGYEKAMLKR
jgi:putative ATPase